MHRRRSRNEQWEDQIPRRDVEDAALLPLSSAGHGSLLFRSRAVVLLGFAATAMVPALVFGCRVTSVPSTGTVIRCFGAEACTTGGRPAMGAGRRNWSHAIVTRCSRLQGCDGIGPKALNRPHRLHFGLLGFLLAVLGVTGIQHWLQNPPTGIDEPVVDLEKGQVGLSCYLPLFIFSGIGVHDVLEQPRAHDARRLLRQHSALLFLLRAQEVLLFIITTHWESPRSEVRDSMVLVRSGEVCTNLRQWCPTMDWCYHRQSCTCLDLK